MALEPTKELLVKQVSWEADGVISVVLVEPDGGELAPWEPGAHLEVILPSGLVRQYSLCGDPKDRSRYRVSVLREVNGRGGSVELHTTALVGRKVEVRGPRNRFPLEPAPSYLFIAGGIGITPILAMVRALGPSRPWRLLYGGRSRRTMAFVEDLMAVNPGKVTLVPQDEAGLIDLDAAFSGLPETTQVYVCGPSALIQAVQEKTELAFGDSHFHAERFSAAPMPTVDDPALADDEFEVELRASSLFGRCPADTPLLEVIRSLGVEMPSSCEEGICGTCETVVIEGTPDHRDQILTDGEKADGHSMFPCVSRSLTPKLVLDL